MGASSASAIVLCTKNENPCKKENVITTLQATLKSSETSVIEETSGKGVSTCTALDFDYKVSSNGQVITGTLPTWDYTGCDVTTDVVKTGELVIQENEKHEPEVIAKGTEVTVPVLGVSCTYGAGVSTNLGHLTIGEPASFVIDTTFNKTAGGVLCPSDSRQTGGTWPITNHKSVFIAATSE
jgi:hypothetical protein